MNYKFQIFGSESSLDLDVLVFVDSIPSIQESHILCGEYDKELKEYFKTDKEVNTNLAVLKNGNITDVFKGTIGEVNNSLYYTYEFHKQYYPNMIESLMKRNVQLKVSRVLRMILTLLSRTEHRILIKKALRSGDSLKIKTLYNIDLTTIPNINKNISDVDYRKTIAVQLGQVLGLLNGKEFYTKESISEEYVKLKPFLDRDVEYDMSILEKYKTEFLNTL
jgi:hypothetical protein